MRVGESEGVVRTRCTPFVLDLFGPGVVPQLKHLVPFEQPKVTEVAGQRESSETVSEGRPGIDKDLELLPCELCWVVVKKLLVCR